MSATVRSWRRTLLTDRRSRRSVSRVSEYVVAEALDAAGDLGTSSSIPVRV